MLSPDPRETEYPWQSTYAYFKNSPISTVDYLGGGGRKGHDGKEHGYLYWFLYYTVGQMGNDSGYEGKPSSNPKSSPTVSLVLDGAPSSDDVIEGLARGTIEPVFDVIEGAATGDPEKLAKGTGPLIISFMMRGKTNVRRVRFVKVKPKLKLTTAQSKALQALKDMRPTPKRPAYTQTGVGAKMSGKIPVDKNVKLRHYTSNEGLKGIEADMKLKAYDQNKVFTDRAKGKPLSAADASEKFGIAKKDARNYVEFEVPESRITIEKNGTTGATERTIKGDIELNPKTTKFVKRQ